MSVKVLCPFNSDDKNRKKVWRTVKPFWNERFTLVTSELDLSEFSRSKTRNNLLHQVDAEDIIVFVDADIWVDERNVWDCIDAVESGHKWAIGYQRYYRLNEESSDFFLDQVAKEGKVDRTPRQSECTIGGFRSYASCLIMTAEFFQDCGGCDERFMFWSYEDDAFNCVAKTFGGEPYRPRKHSSKRETNLIHFWHPEPLEDTWEQPYFKHNEELFKEYKALEGKPVEMTEYIEGRYK